MSDNKHKDCPVVLQTGFRIFFLGAAFYAVLGMALWYLFYVAGINIFVGMPLTVWHGHEMIFGFTMAVVAGFLLTAVMNWTGLPTISGAPLLFLFLIWCLARIFAFMPSSFPFWPSALCNILFIALLIGAVMKPIIIVKQWKQSVVFSILMLILTSGVAFYVYIAQSDLVAERKALRFAVYIIIGLIFTIGRRVIPFFIERGVGYSVTLRNSKVLDLASLICLVSFSFLDVLWPQPFVIAILSAVLFIVHILRLSGWYTPGIWKKPLLWILFVGYMFLILGFLLKIIAVLGHHPDDAALHAWTVGGIGVMTLGMMSRISWGHTGRSIAEPPKAISVMFILIILSALFRVFLPIFFEPHYIMWVAISQILWMLAFGMFLIIYFPVLTGARPDGKRG